MKQIQSLDLTCCRKITQKGIQYLFENNINLKSLNLTGKKNKYFIFKIKKR
jgi:hypothetical protein